MRILIVEDEARVAQDLCDILLEINPSIEILAILESVNETVSWLDENEAPDLGFFDIRIADGISFDIFEKVDIIFPIIFTTAFDDYALKAFKVNSIDYILKPVKKSALERALNKYFTLYEKSSNFDYERVLKVIGELKSEQQKKFRKSFLVYIKDKIIPILVEDIAYFYLENDTVFCITHDNEKYFIDQSLDRIQKQLDPDVFFRASRQFIVSRIAVNSASNYFHRKLKLSVKPSINKEITVSKINASNFKKWLTGI